MFFFFNFILKFYRNQCATLTCRYLVIFLRTMDEMTLNADCHKVNTARNIAPVRDVAASAFRLKTVVDLKLREVAWTVCCTDDIALWQIVDLTVASGRFFERADDLVEILQLRQRPTSVQTLMRCVCGDVETAHLRYQIVCHSKPHRRKSNCMRMVAVMQLPERLIVHERRQLQLLTSVRTEIHSADNLLDKAGQLLCLENEDSMDSQCSKGHDKLAATWLSDRCL